MAGLAETVSSSGIMRRRGQRILYALVLLLLFSLGLALAFWEIQQYETTLLRKTFILHETGTPPVSVMEISPINATDNSPVLLVAHGYSANKETMQAIGVESALRLNLRVLLLDFPGHGLSPERFSGDLASDQQNDQLVKALNSLYQYTRRTYPDAPVALLGHSMGTGVVARLSARENNFAATILLSPARMPDYPELGYKNLLVLVGDGDISQSLDEAKKVYALSTGMPSDSDYPTEARKVEGAEQGDPLDGTAKRVRVLSGTNHITILYTADTLSEVNSWLDRTLFKSDGKAVRAAILDDQNGAGFRLRWTIVGIIFAVCLIYPVSSLLVDVFKLRAVLSRIPLPPTTSQSLLMAGILLLAEVIAALLWTPVKPPPQLLGLQLGSYLAGFFLVTGLLVLGWLRWYQNRQRFGARFEDYSRYWGGVILTKLTVWVLLPAGLFALVYFTLGWFSANSWESLQFSPARIIPFIGLVLCLLPYFLADECIFRRMPTWRGYFLGLGSKIGLFAVLFGAVMLSPTQLGFLIIILPVLFLLFAVFGLVSLWLFWLMHDFVTNAVLQTLIFAWVIACFFPVV
ncbi:MAG: alpha/beta fold hydrolase [Chloroflexi bacterium]|uniref:Alpha/beta fold hydrolase n=1 Tax=Candidatus Chlorohelix allophototropha TaxID=3003348 RepID=A0A8T7M886_9CHLR|nr:alpha/beta fold hydrolase [Chloroflexota bacterium]WJW68285.1 lysophospholipase [Chloroflexota bacterium L227-S17]